jgi:hypothetical protein
MDSNRQAIRRLCLVPTICTAFLIAAGYRPTSRIAGLDGVIAMITAQLLILGIILATLLYNIGKIKAAEPNKRLQIALKMSAQRLFFTMIMGAVVALQNLVATEAFLIWLAIAYFVLVQVETLTLFYWMKGLDK